MRYRLRTLMIATIIGPPLLWLVWFNGVSIAVWILVFLIAMAWMAFGLLVCIAFCWLIDIPITIAQRLLSKK